MHKIIQARKHDQGTRSDKQYARSMIVLPPKPTYIFSNFVSSQSRLIMLKSQINL